jgi:hypothetical protein
MTEVNPTRAPVFRMKHEPYIGLPALRLNPAPPRELTVDDECPGPVPVFFPKPPFGGHESLAFGEPEFAAGKRQVPSHRRVIHQLDNGRLVDISEPR